MMARGRQPVIEDDSESDSQSGAESDEEPSSSGQEDGNASSRNAYEVLGLDKSASQVEIKKAYHRMALILHPDKNPGDEEAKAKFQVLQHVFSVLGDPEKRKVYDQTGSLEDSELSGDKFSNLYEYFRGVYQKVSEDDIDSYEASYRGSTLEADELKAFYTRFKGDMRKVFGWLVCSREDLDSHRFKDVLDQAISDGSLETYPRYEKWAKRVLQKPRPSEDPLAPPKARKSKSDKTLTGLTALIGKRQADRSADFFSKLESKYVNLGKASKRKGATRMEEPSEEEFHAAQQRVLNRGAVKEKKRRMTKVRN